VALTHVDVEIGNPAVFDRRIRLRMLVDSGAAYSVVDTATLENLGILPTGERSFILADGTEITPPYRGGDVFISAVSTEVRP
jgi:predicted aspartyl protease